MNRAQLIAKYCYGAKVGAEVGVWLGETSAHLLKHMPQLTLYMVDWWKALPTVEDRNKCSVNGAIGKSAKQMRTAYEVAMNRTEFAADRRVVLNMGFEEAAKQIAHESCDFVFLDADHTEDGTYKAMCSWWSKVKPMGWLCGHDFGHPSPDWGVAQAVRRFRDEFDVRVFLDADGTWWIMR